MYICVYVCFMFAFVCVRLCVRVCRCGRVWHEVIFKPITDGLNLVLSFSYTGCSNKALISSQPNYLLKTGKSTDAFPKDISAEM